VDQNRHNKKGDYGVRNRPVKLITAAYSLVVICLSIAKLNIN